MDTVQETIQYVIDQTRSTASTLSIVRKRTVKHRRGVGFGTWLEEFEESLTLPRGVGMDVLLLGHLDQPRPSTTNILHRTLFILRKL